MASGESNGPLPIRELKLRYQDFASLVHPQVAEFHAAASGPKTNQGG